MNYLVLSIILAVAAAVLSFLIPKNIRGAKEAIAIIGTVANAAIAYLIFRQDYTYAAPWFGFGIEFSLRIYNFSAFIVASAAVFSLLITIYSAASLRDKSYAKLFYSYLLLMTGLLSSFLKHRTGFQARPFSHRISRRSLPRLSSCPQVCRAS